MSQWGNTDVASNSVLWLPAIVNLAPNVANRDLLYGNNTSGSFVSGVTIGSYGVDAVEISVSAGPITDAVLANNGSGYTANAVVTVTATNGGSGGAANAHANSIGRIDVINVTNIGSAYNGAPTFVVAAPAATAINSNTALFDQKTFNANTAVNITTDTITVASNPFINGDVVLYSKGAGTVIPGLVDANNYYVVNAAAGSLKLSLSSGGAPVDITALGLTESHTLTRKGFITISSAGKFLDGDRVTYTVAAGNTALVGIVSGGTYRVRTANSSGFRIGRVNGADIDLVPGVQADETGHTFTGQTATVGVSVGGGKNRGVTHAGWIKRTVGTGGRAGRVQYETLVAMGSMTGDGSDDTILPDS